MCLMQPCCCCCGCIPMNDLHPTDKNPKNLQPGPSSSLPLFHSLFLHYKQTKNKERKKENQKKKERRKDRKKKDSAGLPCKHTAALREWEGCLRGGCWLQPTLKTQGEHRPAARRRIHTSGRRPTQRAPVRRCSEDSREAPSTAR